jgi:hypothetical protein
MTLRSLPALAFAGLACVTNYLLLYSAFPESAKWRLFGAHLFFVAGGVLLGIWEIVRKRWIGLIALLVSAYFLLVQLGMINRI